MAVQLAGSHRKGKTSKLIRMSKRKKNALYEEDLRLSREMRKMIRVRLFESRISEKFTQNFVGAHSLQLKIYRLDLTMVNVLPFLESMELEKQLLSKV